MSVEPIAIVPLTRPVSTMNVRILAHRLLVAQRLSVKLNITQESASVQLASKEIQLFNVLKLVVIMMMIVEILRGATELVENVFVCVQEKFVQEEHNVQHLITGKHAPVLHHSREMDMFTVQKVRCMV